MQINYPGGPYLLNPRRLAAGETAIYDLKEIRNQQIPDLNGRTIPFSVTGGQFKWFIHGAGSGRLIGRAEMLGSSEGISSSYSCPGGNCPAMFSYAWLDPDDVFLGPGDEAAIQVLEIDCDAYWCYGPFSANVTSWDVIDPFFSVLFYGYGANAEVVGVDGGTAYFQANIGYDQYAWDGMACIYGGINIANTQGRADVPEVHIIFNGSGVPLKNGDPPPNTWPSYPNSITMHASANFAGGQFHWTKDSNKVTLANENTDTVTVTSVSQSDVENDVTIKVTWTINNKPVPDERKITVQKPSSLDFDQSGSGSTTTTPTCTQQGQEQCCNSTSTGSQRDMTWQLKDQLGHAITMQIPGSDSGSYESGHNDCLLASFEGSPPSEKHYTDANGKWTHHYWFCTTHCPCTTNGTQTYTFNGFSIAQTFVFSCGNISVSGH